MSSRETEEYSCYKSGLAKAGSVGNLTAPGRRQAVCRSCPSRGGSVGEPARVAARKGQWQEPRCPVTTPGQGHRSEPGGGNAARLAGRSSRPCSKQHRELVAARAQFLPQRKPRVCLYYEKEISRDLDPRGNWGCRRTIPETKRRPV